MSRSPPGSAGAWGISALPSSSVQPYMDNQKGVDCDSQKTRCDLVNRCSLATLNSAAAASVCHSSIRQKVQSELLCMPHHASSVEPAGYMFKRLGHHLPPALGPSHLPFKISGLVEPEPDWTLTNNPSFAVAAFGFASQKTVQQSQHPLRRRHFRATRGAPILPAGSPIRTSVSTRHLFIASLEAPHC